MTAQRDQNRISVIQGISNADGKTLLSIQADPALNAVKSDDDVTGSDMGGNPDPRDENRRVAFMAVSAVDGITPVAVYIDSVTNKLLLTSI